MLALAFATFAQSLLAQLPQARLTSLFPPGATAGSTREVAVIGSDLDEPRTLLFSEPRIVASPKPENASVFNVTVPADVPAGFLEVRFSGRFGVSNPRVFAIGNRPELIVAPTNTSAATATSLPRNSFANGRVAAATFQWFRFDARRGERLLARVQARELDSPLVPDLAVLDTAGQELATARRSPLLDFTVPADGDFLLRLNDQTFRGGDDFVYRLVLTAGPHVDFALPGALRAGETNRVTLLGRNLPGGETSGLRGTDGRPLDRLEVDVAAPPAGDRSLPPAFDALRRAAAAAAFAAESFAWSFPSETGTGARLVFSLTTNGVSKSLTNGLVALDPPTEFSAFFPGPGETSGVTFKARKDDVLWIELFAERLGQISDPWAVVQRMTRDGQGREKFSDVVELNDSDANAGGREFDTSTRDGAVRFQAPEDGDYRVLMRDLYNRQPDGRRLPYRLSVRPETPDFRLVAFPQPQPRLNDNDRQIHLWTTVLRRGETVPIRVVAVRRDGFTGDIELTAENLPTGVTSAPARIVSGQNAASLLLTAGNDASTTAGSIQVKGSSRTGDREILRSAAFASATRHVQDWDQERGNPRATATLPAAVCAEETAPVVIVATDPPAAIAAGARLSVPLAVSRQGEFTAAFNVKWHGHAGVEKLKEFPIPEKATNAVAELNLADAKLAPGSYTLWLQGLAPGKYRNNPEALAAAETELKAADESLKSTSADEKPRAEERRKKAEAAKKVAEERAKPRDVTLAVYSRPIQIVVTNAPANPARP